MAAIFIYNQIRSDIGEILRKLCEYKGIEIIEGHLMPDHVHMLLAIPPKYSVSSVPVMTSSATRTWRHRSASSS